MFNHGKKLHLPAITFLLTGICLTSVLAATYYVDGSMLNDGGSGTSWAAAKKYIYSGIQLMGSGDTLIIRDGTYTGDNNRIKGIPSGFAGNYTTIKAENTFGVILSGLDSGTAPANEEAPVSVTNKSWITIEGFMIKDCTGTSPYALSAVSVGDSDHIRIRKLGIKNGVHSGARYGGAVEIADSSYCLIEDVFACGMMRYGLVFYGGDTNHHNIMRRCVVRWDYCTTLEPRAAITVYGGAEGTTVCSNILLQNCIVIDGNLGSGFTFTGGFSAPHETSDVHRYGCISLNNRGYGFHSSEDSKSYDNTNAHCVIWDSDSGMWWRHLASGISGAYNCTVKGADISGSADSGRGASYDCVAQNNIIIAGNITNTTESGNVNKAITDFAYIMRSPQNGKGATIEKKMGSTGAVYGETGYNTLANESLWPWPFEDKIRELFMEPNTPPAGVSPSVNTSTRGFCANGMTLTKYIWEYLGNPQPVFDTGGEPGDDGGATDPESVSVNPIVGNIKIVGSAQGKGTINPDSGDTAKIYFQGNGAGKFECRIFTLVGELVWEATKENVQDGMFEWAAKNVASGTYVVHIKGPGINKQKKIIIIR